MSNIPLLLREAELQQVRWEGGVPHLKGLTQTRGIMLSEGDKHWVRLF
jgi:hypothetical protein